MKKLAFVGTVLLGCLVIGCASSIKYSVDDGYGERRFEKKTALVDGKKLNEGTFPWEYQPVTVLVTPETRAAEFTAQWVGIDKSVVLKVFGEPAQRIPYPNGFTEECWYYLIRNTKWFVFLSTTTNKVIDIQYQNPGQPMMTTGTRTFGTVPPPKAPSPPENPAPVMIVDTAPPGYNSYSYQ